MDRADQTKSTPSVVHSFDELPARKVKSDTIPKSQPNDTFERNGVSFKINDLLLLSKPPKCCRKSYLNEPPQPTLPYPVSLLSLHLDDNDLKTINKKINDSSICGTDKKTVRRSVFRVNYFSITAEFDDNINT